MDTILLAEFKTKRGFHLELEMCTIVSKTKTETKQQCKSDSASFRKNEFKETRFEMVTTDARLQNNFIVNGATQSVCFPPNFLQKLMIDEFKFVFCFTNDRTYLRVFEGGKFVDDNIKVRYCVSSGVSGCPTDIHHNVFETVVRRFNASMLIGATGGDVISAKGEPWANPTRPKGSHGQTAWKTIALECSDHRCIPPGPLSKISQHLSEQIPFVLSFFSFFVAPIKQHFRNQ